LIHILIGAAAAAGMIYLTDYARKRSIEPSWWQWCLTILAFLYAVFVLEVIAGFLEEGAELAALVMGTILGFAAAVWGVLLGRYVFRVTTTETVEDIESEEGRDDA
jgi:hypothetical protein